MSINPSQLREGGAETEREDGINCLKNYFLAQLLCVLIRWIFPMLPAWPRWSLVPSPAQPHQLLPFDDLLFNRGELMHLLKKSLCLPWGQQGT